MYENPTPLPERLRGLGIQAGDLAANEIERLWRLLEVNGVYPLTECYTRDGIRLNAPTTEFHAANCACKFCVPF